MAEELVRRTLWKNDTKSEGDDLLSPPSSEPQGLKINSHIQQTRALLPVVRGALGVSLTLSAAASVAAHGRLATNSDGATAMHETAMKTLLGLAQKI